MNLHTPQEHLISQIKSFSLGSVEQRQVARRLHELLPSRLRQLKEQHQRNCPALKAWRHALCDKRYTDFLNEYIEISHEAHLARIQYETHLMLVQARQSLRQLRAR